MLWIGSVGYNVPQTAEEVEAVPKVEAEEVCPEGLLITLAGEEVGQGRVCLGVLIHQEELKHLPAVTC